MEDEEEGGGPRLFFFITGGNVGFGNVGNQFSMRVRGIGVEGSHAINFCPTDKQALNKLLEEQPEPILRVLVQRVTWRGG